MKASKMLCCLIWRTDDQGPISWEKKLEDQITGKFFQINSLLLHLTNNYTKCLSTVYSGYDQ